jgi:hypothetical protein
MQIVDITSVVSAEKMLLKEGNSGSLLCDNLNIQIYSTKHCSQLSSNTMLYFEGPELKS